MLGVTLLHDRQLEEIHQKIHIKKREALNLILFFFKLIPASFLYLNNDAATVSEFRNRTIVKCRSYYERI